MNPQDQTDIVMCPACGYELIVKAKEGPTVAGVKVWAYVFPFHEGDTHKGTVCSLSFKIVNPKLRAQYPEDVI